jgi:hypothetical protein
MDLIYQQKMLARDQINVADRARVMRLPAPLALGNFPQIRQPNIGTVAFN